MTTLPRHVAIIMDGNGRWAANQGLPRIEGHRRGVSTVRMVATESAKLGLEALTLYCLSSENWKRPDAEIQFLMSLLRQYLVEERRMIMDNQLRLQVIGRRDRLPVEVLTEMDQTLAMSADNAGTRLVLAIDYGGRDELTRAFRSMLGRGIRPDEVTPDVIAEHLDTAGLPDVDLLIRTGGDRRVSNFLLWQISYAEMWVTDRGWPEFTAEDYANALSDFATRQRRFGGLDR